MKISIHGIQDGAKNFTSEYIAGVKDPSSDDPSDDSVGHKVFAISFTKNEYVISKYGIIRDVQCDKRAGNIGFSLGVPNEKKISGSHIKRILDELDKTFYKRHINNNNLDHFQEDWSFVENIKRDYQREVKPIIDKNSIEKFPQSEKDAAYIYYSSEEELQQYFDVPYQDDYKSYKRVFFVDQKYKGQPENPLNALRHNKEEDLTSRTILENLRYRVFIPSISNGVLTKVTTAEKTIQNNGKVHPKDRVTITFSKKNYKTPEPIYGTISELKEKYANRVKVDDSNKTLSITPPNTLEAKTKTIHFKVENWKGEAVKDAIKIKSKSYTGNESVNKNTATFRADELEQEWEIIVNGKTVKTFVPSTLEDSLTIQIQKEKEVGFTVNVNNYTISVKNLSSDIKVIPGGKKIKFINGAIEQPCSIIIKAEGYKDKKLDDVYPNSQDKPIEVKLEKKKILRYFIDVAKGKKKGSDYIEIYEDESIEPELKKLKGQVTPPKGKRFTNEAFNVNNNKTKGYDGTINAQYEDKPKFYKDPRILSGAAGAIIVLAIGFFIFGPSNPDSNSEKKSEYEQIVKFANGGELSLTEIKKYINKASEKKSPKNGEPRKEQNKSWFSTFFSSSKNKTEETNENEDWEDLSDRLETLKLIRQATNNGQVDSLIKLSETFDYSINQETFKNAVLGIDCSYTSEISKVMKGEDDKVSQMSIDQIAVFLNNYQALLRISKETKNNKKGVAFQTEKRDSVKDHLKLEPKDYLPTANNRKDSILKSIEARIPNNVEVDEKKEQEEDDDKRNQKQKEEKPKKKEQTPANESTSQQESETIPSKSSDAEALEEEFENEFWSLIKEGNENEPEYDELVEKYSDISSDNEIKKFYKDQLSRPEVFEKFMKIPIKELDDIKDLRKLDSLIKKQ